jgi:hypothetical protein
MVDDGFTRCYDITTTGRIEKRGHCQCHRIDAVKYPNETILHIYIRLPYILSVYLEIASHHTYNPSYFTSAFPTFFPWGAGKHIHPKCDAKLPLNTLGKADVKYEGLSRSVNGIDPVNLVSQFCQSL